jgi:Family of unknown function (DUF6328)
MAELLQELRVALPGVQILFAFLLTVPFAQGFTKVTDFQRDLYFATLLATAASTICLIAPSATHRLRFHQRDRAYLVESANRLLIAGLAFLAIAIVCAVSLITDYLFGLDASWIWPAAVALGLLVMWFVRPLLRTLRGDSSGP